MNSPLYSFIWIWEYTWFQILQNWNTRFNISKIQRYWHHFFLYFKIKFIHIFFKMLIIIVDQIWYLIFLLTCLLFFILWNVSNYLYTWIVRICIGDKIPVFFVYGDELIFIELRAWANYSIFHKFKKFLLYL